MLHPSYTELIAKVNEGVEPGDEPVVQSRYSIVCATAKRARQLVDIANDETIVDKKVVAKPLSEAVRELYGEEIAIMTEDEYMERKAASEAEVADLIEKKIEARRAKEAMEKAEAERNMAEESDDEDDDADDSIDEDVDEEETIE